MNEFVNACRKEWKRLGVPDAASNEMAADLEADLAEAAAEGVSPEEVLGNGVFDATSFAASWATAQGLVAGDRPPVTRRRRWTIVVSAAASVVAVLAGLAILLQRQSVSVAASAFRRALPAPFPGPRGLVIGPHVPGRLAVLHSGPFEVLGAVLLLVGLVGVIGSGVTLWIWRPWSALRRGRGPDDSSGMPSSLAPF